MSEVEMVRELERSSTGARQCVVKRGDEHFLVSSVNAYDTEQFETLAFPSDAEGNVTSWTEVAGGIGRTREATIAELGGHNTRSRDERVKDWADACGGEVAAIASTLSGTRDLLLGTLPYDASDDI